MKVPSSCMHACRAARDMSWACSVKLAPSNSCMHDTCLGGSSGSLRSVVPEAAHLRDRACVLSVPSCLKSVMSANFPPSMSMIPVTACMLHVIRQRLSHVGFQVMPDFNSHHVPPPCSMVQLFVPRVRLLRSFAVL